MTSSPDPLKHAARRWLAGRQATDRLLIRWAELEALVDRNRGDLSFAAAKAMDRSEVRQMRALDRRLDRLFSHLNRKAEEIAAMRAVTLEGAMLKIEMALTYTDPSERTQAPWSLVEEELEDLRAVL